MSTTLDIVRDEQIAIIKALTPTRLAHEPFRVSLGEDDFRQWSQEQNPESVIRRFDFEDSFADGPPEVHDMSVVMRPHRADLLVAYPSDYRYGPQNRRDRDKVIRQDLEVIDYAIGACGTGNYTDASAILQSATVEEYESVAILVLSYNLYFYRATGS